MISLMNTDCNVIRTVEDDGVEYTLAAEVDGPRAVIMVRDIEAGETIRLVMHPNVAQAEKKFNETLAVLGIGN